MLLVADCQRISEKLLVDPAAVAWRVSSGVPGANRPRQAGDDRCRKDVFISLQQDVPGNHDAGEWPLVGGAVRRTIASGFFVVD
jgi:hypothetical protein